MSQQSDLSQQPSYYTARAAEERRLAGAATDSKVRAIHLDMAERYDTLAAGGGAERSLQVAGERQRSSA